jgi:hypothetical protein
LLFPELWKTVASYTESRLCVCRKGGIPFALRWIEDARMGAELSKTQRKLRQQFEENRIQFILTELDTATTFCELALSSTNAEKTRRNTANAYSGYETALRIAKKALFSRGR